MEIEKNPGWDWRVKYQDGDEQDEMLVFGAMTIDDALRDAHGSLSSCALMGIEPDYTILLIERLPIDQHHLLPTTVDEPR